ncbi:plasmid maintenance protein CcdB [Tabrizicola sp. TH137]|uniref:CcdB family protein n=1 Tax=Tabrizicola sp. TH137 TaxID=2067452 RepID=UPI000C7A21AA|nr:CcdB family protein [Tabrizicola sp. TH137]PLL14482.1 plasmid maintenance protein CcdB [Tabrizicola sp. TH137]
MARFDVYPAPDGRGYWLDVQADLLGALNTRLIVPLIPLDQAPIPARRLNPVFRIDGQDVVMTTQFLSAVLSSGLTRPVTSLADQSETVMAALDMALIGF